MIANKIVLGAAAAVVLGLATLAGTAGEANATYGHGHGHYKFHGYSHGYKPFYGHNYNHGYKHSYGHNYGHNYNYGYNSCYKYVSQPYYTDYGVEYRQVLVNACGYSYGY